MHKLFCTSSLFTALGCGVILTSCTMVQAQQGQPSARFERQAPLMNPSAQRAIASGESPIIQPGGMDSPAAPEYSAPYSDNAYTTQAEASQTGRRRPALHGGQAPAAMQPSPMQQAGIMNAGAMPAASVSQRPAEQPAPYVDMSAPAAFSDTAASPDDDALRALIASGSQDGMPADGIPEDNYVPPQHTLPSIPTQPHMADNTAQPMADTASAGPQGEQLKTGMWSDFFDFSYQQEPGEQPAYPTLSQVPGQPGQKTASEYDDEIAALEEERRVNSEMRAEARSDMEVAPPPEVSDSGMALAPVVRTPPPGMMPQEAESWAAEPQYDYAPQVPQAPMAMQSPPMPEEGNSRRRPSAMQAAAVPSGEYVPSGPVQATQTGVVPALPVLPSQMPAQPGTYAATPSGAVAAQPLIAPQGQREPDDKVLERIAVGAPPTILGTTAVPGYTVPQDVRAQPYNPAANRVVLRPPSEAPTGVRVLPESRYAARRRSNYR